MAVDPTEGFLYILENLAPEDLKGFTAAQKKLILSETMNALNRGYVMAPRKEGAAQPPFANTFILNALTERSKIIDKAAKGITPEMVAAGEAALKAGGDVKAIYLAMKELKGG